MHLGLLLPGEALRPPLNGHRSRGRRQRRHCALGDRVLLPFEGDRTLSLILSKALLLAADDKITDPTILRQIG
ncbi:MAG TPA: hypothetical protein VFZ65_13915 [Planctomycetota bacterium]|nr:hypothetical protein [Planctomycetota bacterium]